MKFNAAPRIFLETLFSLDFTREFCLEEFAKQKEGKSWEKEEVIEKIREKAAGKMIHAAEEKIIFFDFSKALPKKHYVFQDEKTHITVREPHLSESSN